MLAAWTNRSGSRIVVSVVATTAAEQTVAMVSSALAPRYRAEELVGAEAKDAVRGCQSGSPGWLSAATVFQLSREEAQVLALQWARKAAESAGLETERADRFERLVREGLARAFEEAGRAQEFDEQALRDHCCREVATAIEALGLPEEQESRLREALEIVESRDGAHRPGDDR